MNNQQLVIFSSFYFRCLEKIYTWDKSTTHFKIEQTNSQRWSVDFYVALSAGEVAFQTSSCRKREGINRNFSRLVELIFKKCF